MVEQPEPFSASFMGPTGPYELTFEPNEDEGEFRVKLGGVVTTWHVEVCERDGDSWLLGGLTRDTVAIWGDTYWFEVHTARPMKVEYGINGLVRTDAALEPGTR